MTSSYFSLLNSGAKYVGNKMLRRFHNFLVCVGNVSAKEAAKNSAETLVYLHWKWLRHTLVFCQGLSFGFSTVKANENQWRPVKTKVNKANWVITKNQLKRCFWKKSKWRKNDKNIDWNVVFWLLFQQDFTSYKIRCKSLRRRK